MDGTVAAEAAITLVMMMTLFRYIFQNCCRSRVRILEGIRVNAHVRWSRA